MPHDHALEDDYTPVAIYFRGENHTAAAKWFIERFDEGGFAHKMADMLEKDGHTVTDTGADIDGRAITIVVEPKG